jgi:hypothetical protein
MMIRFGDDVTAATFELFNVWSVRPDWVLEARMGTSHLRITGTVDAPALPGPSALAVAYVDEPRGYTYRPVICDVIVRRLDVARVRVEGTLSVDDLVVELAVAAALVT